MKRKVALGPGAASLILIVVVLSLCMLGMLMQIGSRNDYSLTTRSTEMISRVYDLSARSERRLAELDAVLVSCRQEAPEQEAFLASVADSLPEGMEIQADEVSWKEPLDNRTLICVVRLLGPDHPERTEWISHKLIVEEPEEEWE